MKKKYDFKFRPKTYFGPKVLEKHIGSYVKGQLRRKRILNELNNNSINIEQLYESLSDQQRRKKENFHP